MEADVEKKLQIGKCGWGIRRKGGTSYPGAGMLPNLKKMETLYKETGQGGLGWEKLPFLDDLGDGGCSELESS